MGNHVLTKSSIAAKRHMEFVAEHPEWAKMALGVVNEWGKGETMLVEAIATSLMEVYERGKEGESPFPPVKVFVSRRQRPEPVEAPAPTTNRIIRRAR